MTSPDNMRQPLIPMILAAGLMAAPMLAIAQTTTAPAAPPAASAAAAARPVLVPLVTVTAGSTAMARPRLSQMIGSHVYNENDEKIGEVEDVLLFPSSGPAAAIVGTAAAPSVVAPVTAAVVAAPAAAAPAYPLAVVQVGGFLGMGGRLVTVPLGDLRWNATSERIVMPGATKENLQARPSFEYATLRAR
ncbi:PRC-barrel domain-containing protein [Neoroseomonas oryzicola]|uniref:PRC-barrel domain containing protein n=1 Tax=Neoroseomonas oryzicola TaxID=535904 RepID=A0A9X9WQV3_9PROT|nr:PRC-barrel domain-containing protein [Neoroseomonas oryzicola]MBR0662713.1 PRC-barrel domain containing protein [Neoroseomonas oryzicola]NKE20338.1 PRC-barrel domain containing protein [Neoroseomonas oryzicola]